MVTTEPGASQKADHINQGRLTVVNSVTMCDCAKQSASARTTPRYAVTTPATQYGHGASVPRGHWPPHLYNPQYQCCPPALIFLCLLGVMMKKH